MVRLDPFPWRPATTPATPDQADRIRRLRARLNLTQQQLAELLHLSFATVNRWENRQNAPSPLAWERIVRAERLGLEGFEEPRTDRVRETEAPYTSGGALDFVADAEQVWAVAEAHRLGNGHQFNPTFATESSTVHPLPHQRIAVYEHLLPQPRVRFLLADDAGAGKTVMAGLYLREMLGRRLVRRVLIVPPAGLVGNWQRELERFFCLGFRIVSGSDARGGNPFLGPSSDLVVISLDTLASERTFGRLQDPRVEPYDLVIFDEAHKLSADRDQELRVRRTGRYRVAEALAGIPAREPRWCLGWSARHLLLLTATPHMGKDYPYFALWRLLDPDALPTPEAWEGWPMELRARHFLRRTKEEMVGYDGRRLYPTRISSTHGFALSPPEQELYERTTDYLLEQYNRARILNRSAARLAMSVFQRRLASSPFALLCSLERRRERLGELLEKLRSGALDLQSLEGQQRDLGRQVPVWEETTADEEEPEEGMESGELAEEHLLSGVTASTAGEIEAEIAVVEGLVGCARAAVEQGLDSKFERLQELLAHQEGQRVLVFTEHRDTLRYLVRRLESLGFAGGVAEIHGGMDYREREAQVERFRRPAPEGGAPFLVATDAAGEGINLQFCWITVNYDIPWNPARLEQRMGRTHRYGQAHDPVLILNLVAAETREGKVLKTLLDKLERIRQQLTSDKVFDVVGRLFEGRSLREYMEQALTQAGADAAREAVERAVTGERVAALEREEQRVYGARGDVLSTLPRLHQDVRTEQLRRLLPGYVRRFLERSAPLLGLEVEGDPDAGFFFRPLAPGALDFLGPALEQHPEPLRQRLTVRVDRPESLFLRPGEPVFEALRSQVLDRFGGAALRGAVFADPTAVRPYLLHLALVQVLRQADPVLSALGRPEILEHRLVALRQEEDGALQEVPAESFLLLAGGARPTGDGARLAARAREMAQGLEAWLVERLTRPRADRLRTRILEDLPERDRLLRTGFDYQEADLAQRRTLLNRRLQRGETGVAEDLERVKDQQRRLRSRLEEARQVLSREPELVVPGEARVLAHALVVTTEEPEVCRRQDAEIEAMAVRVAWAFEEARGATVQDVSTPAGALRAGLTGWPGFDLLSRHPSGEERAIEVKGRASSGVVELSENEWSRACNLREGYWLYVVFDCATTHPRLYRVRDPFRMLVTARGGVQVQEAEVVRLAEAAL